MTQISDSKDPNNSVIQLIHSEMPGKINAVFKIHFFFFIAFCIFKMYKKKFTIKGFCYFKYFLHRILNKVTLNILNDLILFKFTVLQFYSIKM